jgi:hypothetical protein
VRDHRGEEHWIEPREGAAETGDKTPAQRKDQIRRIMDLARIAICLGLATVARRDGGSRTYTNRQREAHLRFWLESFWDFLQFAMVIEEMFFS